jgi:hypothetical protein
VGDTHKVSAKYSVRVSSSFQTLLYLKISSDFGYSFKMVITIDLTFASDRLRHLILESIDPKSVIDQDECTIELQDESDLQKTRFSLERLLHENHIEDFVVAENTEKENEIAILKKGDIEQIGIFLCTHCGISFESEIQRIVHQRIHYLG